MIGNPPYGADFDKSLRDYLSSHFIYKKGKPESYIYFLERGISLLRGDGRLGYITPNAWLTNHYGSQLRRHVLSSSALEQLVDLEPTRVFEGAVVDTVITLLSKRSGVEEQHATQISQGTKEGDIVPLFKSRQSDWGRDKESIINLQADPKEVELLAQMTLSRDTLDRIVEYSQGVIPYKTKEQGKANKYISPNKHGKEWLPLIESASQVRRYELDRPSAFIKYGEWLWCAREDKFFKQPKILFHRLRKKLPIQLVGAYDESGVVNRHSLSNLILRPGLKQSMLLAVLALFNSRLSNWWFTKTYGILMEVGGFKVGRIPLPMHWDEAVDRLARFAERMMQLHVTQRDLGNPAQRDSSNTQILSTEQEIDDFIYGLYGLSPGSRRILEHGLPR